MKLYRAVPYLWALAGLALVAVVTGVALRPDPILREAPALDVDAAGDRLSILWFGDVLFSDTAAEDLRRAGEDRSLDPVHGSATPDLIIANAESALAEAGGGAGRSDRWSVFEAMARARPLALSLANNRMLDGGERAVAATLAETRPLRMQAFGAGTHYVEASPANFVRKSPVCRRPVPTCWEPELPFMVQSPIGTIGIVALAEDHNLKNRAEPDTAGFVLLRLAIAHGIHLARRAGADHVVAYVHWGQNYHHVNERQRSWARVFAEAGYDLVIGHHPHVVQPIEIIDGMPVLYSLGNFVFGTRGRFSEQFPGYGLAVTTEFTREGATALKLRCIVTDNRRVDFQPRPCDPPEADSVLTSLHRDVVMHGDVGVLPWSPRPNTAASAGSTR